MALTCRWRSRPQHQERTWFVIRLLLDHSHNGRFDRNRWSLSIGIGGLLQKFPCARLKLAESSAQRAFKGVMKSSGCAIFLGVAVAVCWGAPASSATIKSLAGKHGGV